MAWIQYLIGSSFFNGNCWVLFKAQLCLLYDTKGCLKLLRRIGYVSQDPNVRDESHSSHFALSIPFVAFFCSSLTAHVYIYSYIHMYLCTWELCLLVDKLHVVINRHKLMHALLNQLLRWTWKTTKNCVLTAASGVFRFGFLSLSRRGSADDDVNKTENKNAQIMHRTQRHAHTWRTPHTLPHKQETTIIVAIAKQR